MYRLMIVLAAIAVLVAALALPAGATKPDPDGYLEDGHKITICHATNSLTNPYVEITIDSAAWNDQTDAKKHGDHHTSTKGGVTWSDYVLVEGECSLPTTPPPSEYCAGQRVDIVADFPEELNLWIGGTVEYDLSVPSIAAGTYQVVLGSWDPHHPEASDFGQGDERWRANFGSDQSFYSRDLLKAEGGTIAEAIWSDGGEVIITETASITAEHWSIVNSTDEYPNSVRPLCVGLTAVN